MKKVDEINSFKGEYRWLSNFYPCSIIYDEITYPSTEHVFQAFKSDDAEDHIRISQLAKANEAKKAGRKLKIREDWDSVKDGIMKEILSIKFSDPKLRQLLLDTGDIPLIEGNYWHDNYWGVCTCEKCKGKGKNM